MANNLTDTAENLLLDHMLGTASWTPTTPLKIKLMSANGSDAAAGTEITAGGGYAAGGATITFGAASAGTASNNLVSWTNMPAATVVGAEIWDSNASPKRLWWGPLSANKPVNAGDNFQFSAGSVQLSLD